MAMASSSHSRRRDMAASDEEHDTSPNAKKKPRFLVGRAFTDSEDETEENHDGGGDDEEEEEEESQGEADGDEEEEEESQGEPDGDEEEESRLESDGDGVEEEETPGVHAGDREEAEIAASEEPTPSTRAAAVAGVTVEGADALECGVCCLPLRPPIFQCEVGHVVCSPCRNKLAPEGKCHVCGVTVAVYRRCHAMENLVDSIRVACPHAAHGCASRPAYHSLDAHRQTCPQAPCHCPGEGCDFVASTTKLLDHFAVAHNWPCTTKISADGKSSVVLHDGFNFLRVDHHPGGGATASHRLILLNVTREPFGRAISALCVHPHTATSRIQCELSFSRYGNRTNGDRCHSHYQRSEFDVGYDDLANKLPDLKQFFHFLVPTCVVGDDDQGGIRINVGITIY